jgi:predicted dehydrogenase
MRIAIAGCGRIAELGHIPAVEGAEDLELAALIDPDRGRREALARPGVASHPDVAAALAQERPDLLICCAPADEHLAIAAEAAAAGVPSLVEKPPAADVGEALELASLSPQALIGFNRRFDQGIALAPVIPPSGRVEMSLELSYRRRAWAPHEASDDALLDLGPHLVDLVLFLTGARPVSVRRAVVDGARASFEFETARGRAVIACAQDRAHREVVEVRDGRGRRLGRTAWGRRSGLGARLARRPHPLVTSLRRQLQSLHHLPNQPSGGSEPNNSLNPPLGGGGGRVATAAEGVVVMQVLEAARESARRGGAEVIVEAVWGDARAAA